MHLPVDKVEERIPQSAHLPRGDDDRQADFFEDSSGHYGFV
jgi:hypothetical protein